MTFVNSHGADGSPHRRARHAMIESLEMEVLMGKHKLKELK